MATTIDKIEFSQEAPTELSFQELYDWVIWQFPRLHGKALHGAVHPPVARHGWLPAIIEPQKKRVSVYAHLEARYATPEAAADALS